MVILQEYKMSPKFVVQPRGLVRADKTRQLRREFIRQDKRAQFAAEKVQTGSCRKCCARDKN